MADKARLQFDFNADALKRLDEIKQKSGATTRAEVIRNALRAYEWIINELDPDYTITITEGEIEKSKFRAQLLLN